MPDKAGGGQAKGVPTNFEWLDYRTIRINKEDP